MARCTMSRNIWRVVMVWLAAGLLWLAFGPRAEAATFRGNTEVCAHIGVTFFDITQMRDAGIPWDVFAPWFTETLANARSDSNSYVKDDDDENFIYSWAEKIFADEKLEAVEVINMVEKDCLKPQPASFKRGRKLA